MAADEKGFFDVSLRSRSLEEVGVAPGIRSRKDRTNIPCDRKRRSHSAPYHTMEDTDIYELLKTDKRSSLLEALEDATRQIILDLPQPQYCPKKTSHRRRRKFDFLLGFVTPNVLFCCVVIFALFLILGIALSVATLGHSGAEFQLPSSYKVHLPSLPCDEYPFCLREEQRLNQIMNHSLQPDACDDFYGFVCTGWTATNSHQKPLWHRPTVDTHEKTRFNNHTLRTAFVESCLQTKVDARTAARRILVESSIGSNWPVDSTALTVVDLLKLAGKLQYNFGVSFVVNVRLRPAMVASFTVEHLVNDKRITGKDIGNTVYFGASRITANQVVGVVRQIDSVINFFASLQRNLSDAFEFCSFVNDTNHDAMALVKSLLSGLVDDVDYWKIFLIDFNVLTILRQLEQSVQPVHLLNYLGFQLLKHVLPIVSTFNQGNVEDRLPLCLRVSQSILVVPHIIHYAHSVSQNRITLLKNITNDLFKKVIVFSRNISQYLTNSQTLEKLKKTNILMLGPTLQSYKEPIINASVDITDVLALFRESNRQHYLDQTKYDWLGYLHKTEPIFDCYKNQIYVDFGVFNLNVPVQLESAHIILAQNAWKFAYAITPYLQLNQSLIEKSCILSQYRMYAEYSGFDLSTTVATTVQRKTVSYYWSKLAALDIIDGTPGTMPLLGMYSVSQMFDVYATMSYCKHYEPLEDSRNAVLSLALLRSPEFRRVWKCDSMVLPRCDNATVETTSPSTVSSDFL